MFTALVVGLAWLYECVVSNFIDNRKKILGARYKFTFYSSIQNFCIMLLRNNVYCCCHLSAWCKILYIKIGYPHDRASKTGVTAQKQKKEQRLLCTGQIKLNVVHLIAIAVFFLKLVYCHVEQMDYCSFYNAHQICPRPPPDFLPLPEKIESLI